MIDICRGALYAGLAGLLFLGLTGMCLADPNQNRSMIDENIARMCPSGEEGIGCRQNAGFPMGVPVEVLQSGHGFAFKGNESHVFRLNVEALQPLEPDHIRSLLASNKSLEEIRSEILTDKGSVTYRGSMMLDKSIYPLTGIEASTTEDNSMVLKANLAEIDMMSYGDGNQMESETETVGTISMTISPSNGSMIGKGELNLRQGTQAGQYSILLEMEPRRHDKDMKPPEERGPDR
ncbi:Uncharacterised protein [uncultured archaeon]|nr:Uncharacterised protein [uncultured archaeon]